jgi:hypothetical protein
MRILLLCLALSACGDNIEPPARPDAAVPVNAVAPCLDRPQQTATPPSGQLPCELISPGFQP